MEERDSLRTMLYGLARFGLFWLINIFALIIGKTAILGIVGTFVPKLALYDNPETLSFLSWLIPFWLLTWLFWDDAKRHTAYGLYNPTAVAIILLLTGIVYYVPILVVSELGSSSVPRVTAAVTSIYFPSLWLSKINDDPQVYGLIGLILLIVICMLSYLVGHKYYAKKFAEEEEDGAQ